MKTLARCFAVAGLVFLGCGQETPAEVTKASYHPLADGAWWEYDHDDWTERVEMTATTFEGASAFVMTDSPNPKDSLRSDAIVMADGGRISRMSKDEYLVGAGDPVLQSHVTYGVGFTRFNEAWADQAAGFRETPEYVRIETPPGGTPRAPEQRKHTFEILSLSAEVDTPAGTFNCIQIRRTKDWEAEADGVDASDAETKIFWFARGVGKVRELNVESNSGEVLSAYFIPE